MSGSGLPPCYFENRHSPEPLGWAMRRRSRAGSKLATARSRKASLRGSNEDFQLAVFDTQSGTGVPVPFGTAIKTNPESLNGLALVPAEEPAPVYTSI
jgi:hypothetical protein